MTGCVIFEIIFLPEDPFLIHFRSVFTSPLVRHGRPHGHCADRLTNSSRVIVVVSHTSGNKIGDEGARALAGAVVHPYRQVTSIGPVDFIRLFGLTRAPASSRASSTPTLLPELWHTNTNRVFWVIWGRPGSCINHIKYHHDISYLRVLNIPSSSDPHGGSP